MPESLPRELRSLYELARSLAGGSGDPDELIERVCDETRETFGFESVARADRCALDERGHRLVVEANRAGHAVADGGTAAIPVARDGRVLVCLVARGRELRPAEVDLLRAFGLLAGLLVEKAQRDLELARALAELRRADELKTEFVSVASHELRAPAAIVHGIATTLFLRDAELGDDQRERLRTALYEQTSRLRRLIDQLLDLSRIEAGSIRIEPQRFRLRGWLDGLLPRIAPERAREIEVDLDDDLELRTDPHGLERVAENLIANALKYGAPPIRVRARGGETFCFVVEDRGAGVPAEFVPDLFGRFTRSEGARLSGLLGAGLGLSIARSYAEALGGTLFYEPAEPTGARFVLELPEALPLGDRKLHEERRPRPSV